jgi:hypothetical protein
MYVVVVVGAGWVLLPIPNEQSHTDYESVIRFERLATLEELEQSATAARDLFVLDAEIAREVGLGQLNVGHHELLQGWSPSVTAACWQRLRELAGTGGAGVQLVFDSRMLSFELDPAARMLVDSGGAGEQTPLRLLVEIGARIRDPNTLPVLEPRSAAVVPEVSAALDALAVGESAGSVSEEAWSTVAGALDTDGGEGFRYANAWVLPRYDALEEVQTRAVPVVPVRVAGGVALIVAVLIAHRLYRTRRGPWLNVSNLKGAAIADSITLVFGAVLCAGVPAALISRVLDVSNPLAELGSVEATVFAGVFGLLIGAPIMSLFASSFAPSWVKVDSDGITQQGMILRSHVSWDDIDAINVEERVVRGRDRWGNPTESGSIRLKVLELVSEDDAISLLPPPRRVRKEFVERLREHVPEWQRERLEEHLAVWP